MVREDYYSGEPVIAGSPSLFSTDQNTIIAENNAIVERINDVDEAANMASFAKYDYGSGYGQPRSVISIGGYDPINQRVVYPQNAGSYYGQQQPFYGYGQPNPVYQQPYYSNPYYTQNPYYQQQPYYGYGYGQPPYYNQQYYQQPRYEMPTTVRVEGINPGGNKYLPPKGYENIIDNMLMDFWQKEQESIAQDYVDSNNNNGYNYNNGFYGTSNYYGFNYFGTTQYQNNAAMNREIYDKVEQLKREAEERRIQFNINLSKLAHNIAGHEYDEAVIEERYRGRDVDIPQSYVQSLNPIKLYNYNRLANMVPFDNSGYYREQFAAASAEFNKHVSPDADLKETFLNMPLVAIDWEMQEEQHRRRNAGLMYRNGDNSYKYFVRKKAAERYAAKKGLNLNINEKGEVTNNGFTFNFNQANQLKKSYLESLPTLSQNATLSEDGTLNVSLKLPCNVGDHKGEEYTVHNANEAEYDEKSERFSRFINSIVGDSYIDKLKEQKIEGYNYD